MKIIFLSVLCLHFTEFLLSLKLYIITGIRIIRIVCHCQNSLLEKIKSLSHFYHNHFRYFLRRKLTNKKNSIASTLLFDNSGRCISGIQKKKKKTQILYNAVCIQ